MDEHLSTTQMSWVLGRSPGTIRELMRLIDELIATNEARPIVTPGAHPTRTPR